MKGAIKYAVKFYNYPNEYLLTNVKIPKRRKTIEDIEKDESKNVQLFRNEPSPTDT
ncbi:integrase [Staphylococcus aureus]|nr:integrase [Staphylococcus aureus]